MGKFKKLYSPNFYDFSSGLSMQTKDSTFHCSGKIDSQKAIKTWASSNFTD